MKRTGNREKKGTYQVVGNAWDRQDWDTDTSYAYFAEYFLKQSAPRKLDVAYRDWAKGTGKYKDVSDLRATRVWRRWVNAKTGSGLKQNGALTWWARAQAFDDHRTGRWDADVLTKQQRQIETEIRRWEKLGEHVDNLLGSVVMFRKSGTKRIMHPITGEETYIDTMELNVGDYRQIGSLMREVHEGMRLALSMPSKIIEAQHGGSIEHTVIGKADEMKPIFDEMKKYEQSLIPANIVDMRKDA